MSNSNKAPRTCIITGEGMHEGYLLHTGETINRESSLLLWLKKNHKNEYLRIGGKEGFYSDDFILSDAHEQELYLWTEWYQDMDEEGNTHSSEGCTITHQYVYRESDDKDATQFLTKAEIMELIYEHNNMFETEYKTIEDFNKGEQKSNGIRSIKNEFSTAPIESGVEQITEFMYFANNFPHNWIQQVWSDNTSMCNHIASKWANLNQRNSYGGTLNFFKLYMELDGGNQAKLCEWITLNYSSKL
jgi:hypothetical protein|tara:strand:- start:1520 stop:2254 length:735 start_codon:yes stop_codon:yes gene_type:complete